MGRLAVMVNSGMPMAMCTKVDLIKIERMGMELIPTQLAKSTWAIGRMTFKMEKEKNFYRMDLDTLGPSSRGRSTEEGSTSGLTSQSMMDSGSTI